MTVAKCTTACSGFKYAGVEYGQECCSLTSSQLGCGNVISAPGAPATSGCSKVCAGNATEYCGGSSRLNVYQFGTVDTSTSSITSSTSASSTTSSPPTATGLPTGWSYRGCHIDNAYGAKILVKTYPDDTQLTPQKCVATCVAAGYNIAGVENGKRMCKILSVHCIYPR